MTPTRTAELLHDAGLPAGVYNLMHGGKDSGRVAGAPAGAGDFVRRIEAGGEVHLCDRGGARQARAGVGRREESSGGDAGRQSRESRRGHHRLRFRRGRRALPGGQRAGGGGRSGAPLLELLLEKTYASCKSATVASRAPRWARWSPRNTASACRATSKKALRKGRCLVRRAPQRIPAEAISWARRFSISVTPEMTIAREEIFGPVLSVIRVDTWTRPSSW